MIVQKWRKMVRITVWKAEQKSPVTRVTLSTRIRWKREKEFFYLSKRRTLYFGYKSIVHVCDASKWVGMHSVCIKRFWPSPVPHTRLSSLQPPHHHPITPLAVNPIPVCHPCYMYQVSCCRTVRHSPTFLLLVVAALVLLYRVRAGTRLVHALYTQDFNTHTRLCIHFYVHLKNWIQLRCS